MGNVVMSEHAAEQPNITGKADSPLAAWTNTKTMHDAVEACRNKIRCLRHKGQQTRQHT